MSETETENGTATKIGRPKGSRNKPEPKRRNYAKEFQDLQNRVWTAISQIERSRTSTAPSEWLDAAVETLKGKTCES